LPVLGHQPLAGPTDAAAVLLQAGEHGLIAVVDDWAAKARSIARAGVVLARRLRQRAGGDQDEANQTDKSGHWFRLHVRPGMRATAF
jgi:hypothetical protein